MPDFIVDRRDIEFLLFEQLDLLGLTELEPYRELGRADFDSVLDSMFKLARDVLAPTGDVGDRTGCVLENGQVRVPEVFREALRHYAEGGWIGLARSPDYGGMGLPLPLAAVIIELGTAAGPSFYFFPALSTAAGHLLENFAVDWLRELVVPRYYDGRWSGTMCLTEPQAGTSVGDLRTTATPVDGKDGTYAIKGNKIFISCGDHDLTENIVHLVLARVAGDPPGTKGISLFAVPKKRFDAQGSLTGPNDVTTTAIEEKMGIHGSPTCALAFGDEDGCEGYLIGERCKGLVYMFQMMNEARIACGIQGVGAANYAYQLALAYARDRIQGSKLTDTRPDAPRVPILEHPDVRRNLMLCKAYAEGIRALLLQAVFFADQAQHAADDAARATYQDLTDLLTPVCKAYATDIGFRVTELAMQVHGGYGYVKDYGVERLMRDVKIASIYEGTNGVQALDLLGRKLRLRDGALFMTWLQHAGEMLGAHAEHPRLAAQVAAVDKAKNTLADVAMGIAAQAKTDPELPLVAATPFLEMFGHVEVARLLVQGAIVADAALQKIAAERHVGADGMAQLVRDHSEARFYDGKVKTAQFFVATVLPHAVALGKAIKAADRSALDIVF